MNDMFDTKLIPPKTEAEIMQSWGDLHTPLVSICCSTYNHVRYIKDAIDSFLSQQTKFPFEIIVRDDASTDGTTEVIREYAKRYPNIIRVVVEPENKYRQGVRAIHVWPELVKGDFVALCEGDDFWVKPYKLQKQIELMQKYPEAVMSVARTDICIDRDDEVSCTQIADINDHALLNFEDIKTRYFHTSTYVIHKNILDEVITKYFLGHSLFGDTALRLILITYGPFVLLPEVVSVYRQSGTGIWTSLDREKQLQWEINVAERLADVLSGEYKSYQYKRLFQLYKEQLRIELRRRRIASAILSIPRIFSYGTLMLVFYLKRPRG